MRGRKVWSSLEASGSRLPLVRVWRHHGIGASCPKLRLPRVLLLHPVCKPTSESSMLWSGGEASRECSTMSYTWGLSRGDSAREASQERRWMS